MRIVSTYNLRENLADYLEKVYKADDSFLISRFGKPVAVIAPYKKTVAFATNDFFGFLGKGLKGSALLGKNRRSPKEKALINNLRSRNSENSR